MRRAAVTVLPFLLAGLLAALFLDYVRADKERQYLAQYTEFLSTAYSASIQMYSLATQTVYQEVVARDDILALLAEGAASTGEARALARGRLYRALYPAYLNLVENNVRQFHFVLADGTSYLRMHQPDRAGDEVLSVRPALRLANAERRPVQAFEAGKIMSGFRFAYPIAYHGQHLGAVEISISFQAIREAMAALDPAREYDFVVRRAVVASVLFDGQEQLYTESAIHPEFWVEDPLPELFPDVPDLSPLSGAANLSLRDDDGVQQAMNSGDTFTVGARAQGRDVAVSFVPVRDLTGELAGYVISYTPTEILAVFRREFQVALLVVTLVLALTFALVCRLLRQRAALAQERNRLEVITQTMADGLYVLDAEGRATFINAAGTGLIGYGAGEVLGRSIHDLIHGHAVSGGLPLEDCPIFRTVRSGQAYQGEEVFVGKSGRSFPTEVKSVPLVENGAVRGTVTVFRDITAQKARERERESIIAALRHSNEEMSRLAEVMAHHLQEPVRRVVTFAHLLRRRIGETCTGAEETHGVTFAKLEAEAMQMRSLIRDVEIYLAAGQPPRQVERVDARAVAEEELAHRAADLEAVGAEATVGDLPAVNFDRRRLRCIFEALIDNAIRYHRPDRPLRLSIDARMDGDRVVFRVADNGHGIPPEFRERVFRLFERLHPDPGSRSTGIGLSLVRRLIECGGGNVDVAAAAEGGAAVVFDIAAADPAPAQAEAVATAATADA
ncbi:ATP-binding protein [Caenispirillum bisanense]|uniref:ATP-binding protein n=1 Tax=Caenispirillum bisanense TaxID=414052 RepID=UPI0031D3662D